MSRGKKAGTLNRRTVQQIEQARIAVENARGAGLKLGKDILEEFAHLFAAMAAYHQPLRKGQQALPDRDPNEDKFLTYAKLACQTASDLAAYQSPKFAAVRVSVTPGTGDPSIPKHEDHGKVIDITDAVTLSRVFANRIKQVKK